MQQWEYFQYWNALGISIQFLNNIGDRGWELMFTNGFTAIFKRPKITS